ncbi:larval cuticle protein LCP-22-like [Rhopalosiphum padi]|uniref:larval cuticle protein LCP-22-like n=1 Tax=Rhopalosiphum padi TaxID=40932 RepID=UPI00298E39E9|nr:larval cuticle protein LCP-22-like [Rhopalosiphum padi]
MKFLVVLVAVIAAVSAATPKEAVKAFPYSGFPSNQAYYPGQQAYYPGYQGYQGYQGYNFGFRNGYYPGQQSYYPGYQGYQGYYPGYQSGYQGYYPGYQGYNNRGFYPGAPAVYPTVSAVTPAPIIAPVPVVPKVVPQVFKAVDNKLPAIVRQSQEVNVDGNFKYGFETENGIVAQAAGYVKNAGSENAAQVIEGSYAYIGDDGAPVEVKYYADETGFHAAGNVVPTIPSEIAKSLEFNAAHPQKSEDSKKK